MSATSHTLVHQCSDPSSARVRGPSPRYYSSLDNLSASMRDDSGFITHTSFPNRLLGLLGQQSLVQNRRHLRSDMNQKSTQKSTVRIRAKPVILGGSSSVFFLINCVVSLGGKSTSSGSPCLPFSTVVLCACSGYGQGRIKNQPRIIGAAVPSARVSKKPEVSPGKIVYAIVEKTKADNPKPAMIIPVAVVL